MTARRSLVEANDPLSMRWQCELLGVNRSSLYYEPVEPDAEELAMMRRMDELHLRHPFFGSRMMTQTLKAEGAFELVSTFTRLGMSFRHFRCPFFAA